ncbi:hypothetical protein BJV77DRAFT_1082340 [Russula vinacea]|nr:hypothetical protein BJV77DRAFT_1082340 [Russula vinacea]
MISKSFVALIFLFAFTSSVNAQVCMEPALGVSGTPTAQDVRKPTDALPCGGVNIAQNLESSTPIQADKDGKFSPSSLASQRDGSGGSQSIATVKVDPSATGNNFVAANMLTNGPSAPAQAGTQQLSVQLPTGINCTGGTGKNLCLASFVTTQGEGNCVVVKAYEADGSQSKRDAAPARKSTRLLLLPQRRKSGPLPQTRGTMSAPEQGRE